MLLISQFLPTKPSEVLIMLYRLGYRIFDAIFKSMKLE